MDEPIIVSSSDKPDNGRVKKMAMAGVAVLLLLVVVPRLLGGGGSPSVTEFPVSNAAPKAAAPATGGDSVPETFQGFTSKNPFKPLVTISASSSSDVAAPTVDPSNPVVPTDVTGPPATIPGDLGTGDDGVVTTPVPPVPPAQSPPPVPVRQLDRVGLLTIYGDQSGQTVASVRVNDTTYQVSRGDSFAGSYQVISLDPYSRCGDFLFGDDRFRLCEGDEVMK